MDLLPSGRSSIEDVCKRLNMGRRNLQRLLRDEGTNYRAVLDNLRQELALSYLRDDAMRVEEVSYLLAFSDPSSFTGPSEIGPA
ncbi:MAG: helix-turn-helix domain-containing protein [Thiolinea sp.]